MCGFQDDVIHCKSTRVAVVTYGTTATVAFDLNHSKIKHTSRINVKNDIATIPQYPGGWTATGDALQLVNDQVFQVSRGMRPYGKKSILLLTDGHSNHGQNPVTAANALRTRFGSNDFSIIALGIGSNIDYQELKDITFHQNPNNPFVAALNNYADFQTTVNQLLQYLQAGTSTCTATGGSILLDKKRK